MEPTVEISPRERWQFMHSTRLLSRHRRKGESGVALPAWPEPAPPARVAPYGVALMCEHCGKLYTGQWSAATGQEEPHRKWQEQPRRKRRKRDTMEEEPNVECDHVCQAVSKWATEAQERYVREHLWPDVSRQRKKCIVTFDHTDKNIDA